MMDGYLLLNEMRFHAFHGVIPTENVVGGEYSVTLRIRYDFREAAQRDEITKAINYAQVYECVKEEMASPSQLIENVALRIQERVIKDFPQITELETRVSKHNPPIPGAVMECATVVLIAP